MTNRRAFIAGALAVLSAPLAAQEKPPARIYRVGMLDIVSAPANAANLNEFRKGLRELGYVEGKNLLIEHRSAEGRSDRYRELAAELVKLEMDVLVTRGTPATLAAKAAPGDVPVVTAMVVDPVETGLVASLTKPGGKVTGLAVLDVEVESKRMELLKALAPKIKRVGAVTNMGNPALAASWKLTEAAARNLKLEAELIDVRRPEQIPRAFEAALAHKVDGLMVRTGGVTPADRKTVVELAAQHKLPAMYVSRQFVDLGGLVSYGVNIGSLYYQAAGYVDKVLKGAKPAELPMETPSKFELVINRRTVRSLDLVIPPDILLRSTETVQ
jgi:ABC-type uncharacterized transport system substrate-binding protein